MNKRKKLIELLNNLFSNDEQLNNLCDTVSNDYDTVIKAINMIIKYVFVDHSLLYNGVSLSSIFYKAEYIDVELEYKKYLNESNGLLKKIFSKKEIKNYDFSFLLDSDIRVSDLKGLRLPTLDKIKEICNKNIAMEELRYKEMRLEKENKKCKYESYRKFRGFDEVGFYYKRRELVPINSSLIYYHDELSGDVSFDFDKLYSSERYTDSFSNLNPLKNSYQDNIRDIKNNSDISLFKKGNVYEIENGRHRIMYILKNGKEEKIPVYLTRRFENKKVNIILKYLKDFYDIDVYKNNLLNDEINILINLYGKCYVIENEDDLIRFFNDFKDNKFNMSDSKIPFNIENDNVDYKDLIFNKYLEIGEDVLLGNFTDLCKYFDNINNLYYQAFMRLQSEYQDSLIYGYDFKESYINKKNRVIEMNKKLDDWQEIMGDNKKKKR